ncbi:FERM domain-containing protein 6 [Anabarilius grahami]|uniref:FERM domain-containing protein 6 n=1 Tax=Anabarilius grahami TaxID=495550 RepID=A0A3N0XNA4_ANAGA|nr:FERM domain-containing protein 6 [Anabarilius grahami]
MTVKGATLRKALPGSAFTKRLILDLTKIIKGRALRGDRRELCPRRQQFKETTKVEVLIESTSIMKNQSRGLIVILPNNTKLNMTVELKDRGQDVFNQLSELLGISDLHLFGLSVEEVVLSLKVQYFVENVQLILNSEARQLYYAELKGRVLRSECFEQEGLYFQLAAYALQADLGDYEERKSAYFSPLGFFPFWIIQKRRNDYILEHTPTLHRELKGMSSSEAALLFMQEAYTLSDVPLTIYRLFKEKKQGCVLVGLTSRGLQISEMLNGKQFLYDLPWSDIHSISFQGRKFDIRADGMREKKMVFYSFTVLHAIHLLQHIRSSHRLHLNTKPLVMQLKEKNDRGTYREMYITDGADLDMEDSDDELPPMKFLLDQKRTTGTTECRNVKDSDVSKDPCGLEMSVDEPEEMFVDDPEDILRLVELVEGVSVDGPLPLPISHWKGETRN